MKTYTPAQRADYRDRAASLLTIAEDAERNGQHSTARAARRAACRNLTRAEARGWFRRTPVAA